MIRSYRTQGGPPGIMPSWFVNIFGSQGAQVIGNSTALVSMNIYQTAFYELSTWCWSSKSYCILCISFDYLLLQVYYNKRREIEL